jgi:AbrB family looped-hinge helix DNA binding protein
MRKMAVETTKISKRGQVVVPKSIRENLRLVEGDSFLVYGKEDTIILKKLQLPGVEEFERLVRWGTEFARKKRITRKKVAKAIQEFRGGARASGSR